METQQRDMRAAAANARAARTLSKQKRWAEEMRANGWVLGHLRELEEIRHAMTDAVRATEAVAAAAHDAAQAQKDIEEATSIGWYTRMAHDATQAQKDIEEAARAVERMYLPARMIEIASVVDA